MMQDNNVRMIKEVNPRNWRVYADFDACEVCEFQRNSNRFFRKWNFVVDLTRPVYVLEEFGEDTFPITHRWVKVYIGKDGTVQHKVVQEDLAFYHRFRFLEHLQEHANYDEVDVQFYR